MATEETSNDAKKAGGYVKEKLAIVASRWNEDEVSRAIIKVTSHKLKFPNEKHLARLVQATYGNFNSGSNTYDDVNGYIVQELIPHTHTHNWIVVLKTLLVFHVLLVEGSDDIVVRIANARQVFNTQHMKDLADSPEGAAQMGLIHQYARYLEEKCVALTACRQFPRIENARFADDFCAASPEAAAPVADALLLQMDALLEFEFRANALDNFASLEAYKRSLKDGRLIYVVLTRRIAAMLETFRGYPTVMKKVWISIYKRYADVVKGLSLTFDLINSNTNVNFGEVYPTIKPMPEGVLLQLQDELLAEEVPVVKLSSVLSTPSSLSSAAPVPLAATSIGRNMSPAEAAAAAVASGMAAVQARSRSPDILRRNAAPPAVPIVQQQTAPVGIYGAPQAPFVVDPPPTKPSYASPPTQSAHPVDAFLPSQQPTPPQPPQRNAIDDLFGPTPTAAAPPPAQQPQPLYPAPSQPQPNLFGPSPVAAPQPHYAPAPQPQPTPVAVAPAPAFDPFAQPPGQTNAWGSTTATAAGQPYHRTQQADFDPFAPVAPAPVRQAPAAQQHGPVDFFGGTGAQQQQQQPSSASTAARPTAGSAEAQLDFFAQAQQQPNRRAW